MAPSASPAPSALPAPSVSSFRKVLVAGKKIGAYFTVPESWKPLRQLGDGSHAVVAAFAAPNGSEFAVKKVDRVFSHKMLALRTLREVRLLAHFNHPNLLSLHEVFLDGPQFQDVCLSLERMDADLHKMIHGRKERLSDTQVQCVLYQVMRGLLCLHRAQVIHRDLKPSNILIRCSGEVKISDLGMARGMDSAEEDHSGLMLTGYVVTRYYRAPEIALTSSRYTYAVDMWSIGCILSEMLTKRPIFEGKDTLDQVTRIIEVLGKQSLEDMAWIPESSSAWEFVEMCHEMVDPLEEGLTRRLQMSTANPLAVELAVELLQFHPSKRISVEEAISHGYFSAFGADKDPEVKAALSVEHMDWSFNHDLCYDPSTGQQKRFEEQRFRASFLEAQRRLQLKQTSAGTDNARLHS